MYILKDVLAKKPADLTAGEKAFLQENWKELSDEQKTEFAEVAPADAGSTEGSDNNSGTGTDDEADEKALKDLITKSIAEKVEILEVEEKISVAAAEVAKSLGEQRKKAIGVIKTTEAQDQSNVKAFFRAVLSNDYAALKALNTGTNSAGGYTIPKELSLDIIRNASLEYGAARRLFNNYVFSGAGNTVDMLKEGDGITAYWTNEGAAKSSSQPSFAIVSLALKKLATIVPFTDEMLEDTGFDLIGYVKELAGRGFAKEEDNAFLMGTGTPYTGLMNDTNVNIVRITGTNPKAFTVDDLQALIDATPSSFLTGSRFAMNRLARSVIRLIKDDNNNFIFSPATAGNPSTVLGYEVEEVDALPDLSTTGNDKPILAFGNFKTAGTVATKGALAVKQLSEATITDVDGTTEVNLAQQDMTALRFVERVGFLLKQPKAVSVLKTKAS
jgi:HK97 family phage major capsid protein